MQPGGIRCQPQAGASCLDAIRVVGPCGASFPPHRPRSWWCAGSPAAFGLVGLLLSLRYRAPRHPTGLAAPSPNRSGGPLLEADPSPHLLARHRARRPRDGAAPGQPLQHRARWCAGSPATFGLVGLLPSLLLSGPKAPNRPGRAAPSPARCGAGRAAAAPAPVRAGPGPWTCAPPAAPRCQRAVPRLNATERQRLRAAAARRMFCAESAARSCRTLAPARAAARRFRCACARRCRALRRRLGPSEDIF